MRNALALCTALLAGCIEGPEPDSVYNVTPRTCETGVAPDQTFEITGMYELARQARLREDPPRFAIDSSAGRIDVETTVGEYGTMTLTPQQLLPADDDLVLRLLAPGALDGAQIPPGVFPATYSTRSTTTIRSYRAIDSRLFISFSQALDPASVAGAVTVTGIGAPTLVEAMYLDAPGHVVYVLVSGANGPVDVTFGTALRTSAGAPVFDAAHSLQLDPTYTVPAANGCESAE